MKRTVSAPGKLMLLGEHAVVYNRPCLVTSVDQRLYLQIEYIEKPVLIIEAEDVGIVGYERPLEEVGSGTLPKSVRFIEHAVRNFGLRYPFENGISIKTKSEFSSEFGFGSSSATAVCTIKALSELLDAKLEKKEIFEIAYKTVLDVQGAGSGFDIAAAVYGGTLYYLTGGTEIEPLDIGEIPMVVGYTGFKADTTKLIAEVAEKAKRSPDVIDYIYTGCESLVLKAKESILKEDWPSLGELMDYNQGYLEALGVSSARLSSMIYAAREAGAYGAKLSGAGKGDCMISIVKKQNRSKIAAALEKAGGKVVDVSTGVEGVRMEEKNL